jgi:carbon storage regulator CsrA
MLILIRERDETIVIRGGGVQVPPIEIIITVVDISGRKVRLGFDAPNDVSVNREELQQAIDAGANRIDAEKDNPLEHYDIGGGK